MATAKHIRGYKETISFLVSNCHKELSERYETIITDFIHRSPIINRYIDRPTDLTKRQYSLIKNSVLNELVSMLRAKNRRIERKVNYKIYWFDILIWSYDSDK